MIDQLKENVWVPIAICLLLLWGIEKLEHKKDVQDQFQTIMTLRDQKKVFEVALDEMGAQTAKQEVLLIKSEQNYRELLADFHNLEKTKAQTRVVTKTSIDSIVVPVVTVDTVFVEKGWMPIYTFRDTSEFYSISGRVSSELALIDDISFPNNVTFSHRWERKNILSKKTYFVEVKNSNPYVQIQGIQNYQLEDEKRFWEMGKFWFAVGLGAGILVQ
tara:strand:- start:20 stop:670 length:651 start_codon:yes stop_codon:yes gene_type:complete